MNKATAVTRYFSEAELSHTLDLSELGLDSPPLTEQQHQTLKFTLQQYNISSNDLFVFPALDFPHLVLLDLSHNQLRELSDFSGLPSLRIFRANNNRLTCLPDSLCSLVQLTELSLGYNELTQLPLLFSQLTNLQQLSLHFNSLTHLDLAQLTQLQTLQISSNPFPSIADVRLPKSTHLQHEKLNLALPDKVEEYLYLGDFNTALNRAALLHQGITHCLSILSDPYEIFPNDFKYLCLDIEDDAESQIKEVFDQCHKFIDTAQAANGKCFVHCAAGVSRSAAIVLSYLMTKKRVTADEALRYLRVVRPVVSPNSGFLEQLKAYEKQLGLENNSI